jgi:hypothetical protein
MRPRARATAWTSYEPNDRQKLFHSIPAVSPTMVKGYIGAIGGGKSTACEQEQIELCLRMPRGLSVATRFSQKRATFSLVDDYKKLLGDVADWHAKDECFTFRNGHTLACMPSDDWQRFGSMELCSFFIQEAHEVSGKIFWALCSRLRNRAGYIDGQPYYRGYIDARGITSSHWINKDFIDAAWNVDDGPEKRATAHNPDFAYLRSRTEDNRENLPPGYIEGLRRQHVNDPNWIKIFLEGEVGYDVEGRAVFGDAWDPDRHVADISEDTSLPILRGWDFGYRAPAVTWSQYTHSGRLLVLRELCPRDISIDELIQQAHALQRDAWPQRPMHTYRDYGDIQGEALSSGASATDTEKVEAFFGTSVESRKARVEDGLHLIRRLMRDGTKVAGKLVPRFAVDRSCETVIEGASGAYYYPEDNLDLGPKKGLGYDAPWDTIRYVAQLVVEEGYVPLPSPYRGRVKTANVFARY